MIFNRGSPGFSARVPNEMYPWDFVKISSWISTICTRVPGISLISIYSRDIFRRFSYYFFQRFSRDFSMSFPTIGLCGVPAAVLPEISSTTLLRISSQDSPGNRTRVFPWFLQNLLPGFLSFFFNSARDSSGRSFRSPGISSGCFCGISLGVPRG